MKKDPPNAPPGAFTTVCANKPAVRMADLVAKDAQALQVGFFSCA
jgi:hypothetical protein